MKLILILSSIFLFIIKVECDQYPARFEGILKNMVGKD